MVSSSSFYPVAEKEALVKEYIGVRVRDLPTPACLVNRQTFQQNCARMRETVDSLGVPFRAHIKTHKTLGGVTLQLDPSDSGESSGRIVVSTVLEAVSVAPLVKSGVVRDILYGLPLVQSKIPDLVQLKESVIVRVMIDSIDQVSALLAHDAGTRWSCFVKIDCGTHRAGLGINSETLKDLIKFIKAQGERIELFGFYCHAGHSYSSSTHQEAESLLMTEIQHAKGGALFAHGLDLQASRRAQQYLLSVGATPTAHASSSLTTETVHKLLENSEGADLELELHAGCYVMNDLQQLSTSMVDSSLIAIRVLAEVVSAYPDRGGEVLINAGTIALAKETSRVPGYGRVSIESHPELWSVVRTSQEHGIIVPDVQSDGSAAGPKNGEKCLIVPQHACITSSTYPWYFVVEQDGLDATVVDIWPRFNGW